MALQRLVTELTVGPLALNEEVTLSHGINEEGEPRPPFLILPATATAITVVGQPNDHTVTFKNLGAQPETTTFLVWRLHSILSPHGSGMFWQGLGPNAGGGGGGSGDMVWRAAWSNATPYVVGDVVTHNGTVYVATTPNLGDAPPSPNWDPVAPASPLTFANVAAALGGAAGANIGWTFKSDGAGSGTMGPNTQDIPRIFNVGPSGDVDYTSISAAIAGALAMGANPLTPWILRLAPGVYVEPPMTLDGSVILEGNVLAPGHILPDVTIFAADPDSDLITVEGYVKMYGVNLSGVTNVNKCAVRIVAGTVIGENLGFSGVSTGLVVDLGSSCQIFDSVWFAIDPSMPMGTGILVKGGSLGAFQRCTFLCDPNSLPFYSQNPIQLCCYVTEGSEATFTTCPIAPFFIDNTQVSLLADAGSTLTLYSCPTAFAYTAIKIGAMGANTLANLNSCFFDHNVVNFEIDSATGTIFSNSSGVDNDTRSVVPGGTISGLLTDFSRLFAGLVGNSGVQYLTDRLTPLLQYVNDAQSSGVDSGGEVMAGAGLSVDVAAGTGWVSRGAPNFDTTPATWVGLNLPGLPANSEIFVYIDSGSLAPTASTTVPGTDHILLAIVFTDGVGVRYVHFAQTPGQHGMELTQQFLVFTHKTVLKDGLASSPGSSVRKFDIAAGHYFRGLAVIAYAGVVDAIFGSFYGSNGANEIPGVASIDITNYDDAGVLTPMTGGFYRADTLYITSDGQVSVIYGTAQFNDQGDAAISNALPPPTFLEPSAFPIAKLVVQQGNGIVQMVDIRTQIATAGATPVISHSALLDLLADDHPQYLLASGGRPMGGNLNMGGNDIFGASTYNGVTIQAHAIRHQPGGIDAIATTPPQPLVAGGAGAPGGDAALSNGAHVHPIPIANVQTIGTANAPGATGSFSDAGHVHNHGAQTDPTQHAPAVAGGANGFLTGTDKAKIDTLTPGAAVASVGATAPIESTGGANPVISIDPATDATPGSMSAADKTKLDGMAPGAAVASVGGTAPITSTGGTTPNIGITAATGVAAGSMSAADKTKLDGISPGAAVASVGGTAPIVSSGGATPAISITPATDVAAGSMSAADKTKLDGIPPGGGVTNVTGTAPIASSGGATPAISISAATSLAAGSMSAADKSKLDGIPPGGGVTNVTGTAPIASSGGATPAISISPASGVAAGSMSAADKSKLDGITAGAAVSAVGATAPITSTGGTAPNIGISAATDLAAGSMSAADKTKLDGIATGATANPVNFASANSSTSTSSASDALLNGMTITPGAGTWLVIFDCEVSINSTSSAAQFSVYANGVQVANSVRHVVAPSSGRACSVSTIANVVVAGGQAIEIRWNVAGGSTATALGRSMSVMKSA